MPPGSTANNAAAAAAAPPVPPVRAEGARFRRGTIQTRSAASIGRGLRINSRDSIYRRALAAADLLAGLTVSALLAQSGAPELLIVGVPLAVIGAAKLRGLYDRDANVIEKSTVPEIPSLFALATSITLTAFLTAGIVTGTMATPAQIGLAWVSLTIMLVTTRRLARACAQRLTPPERCLLAGAGARGAALYEGMDHGGSDRVMVGFLDLEHVGPGFASTRALLEAVDRFDPDRVVLVPGGGSSDDVMFVVHDLKESGVKVSYVDSSAWVLGSSVEVDSIDGATLLGMRRFEINRSSALLKRGFDLVGATVMSILTLPLLIAVAIAIKLDSDGPVIYRQRRIGRHGSEFSILKFRSMIDGAHGLRPDLAALDEGANGLFKIANDPRRTRVGRLIRRYSIDELPQLFNVIRGEMSLVGPRPLVPEEDARIEGRFRRRLDLPPGMTGHWQVVGGPRIPIEQMVRLDYLYIANWSLWGDIALLIRTIPIVIGRRGI